MANIMQIEGKDLLNTLEIKDKRRERKNVFLDRKVRI